MRQQTVEENLVEASSDSGQPSTERPAAIAIFNKAKTTTDVSSTPAANLRTKNQNRLRDEDIDHIVTTTAALRRANSPGIAGAPPTWRGARSLPRTTTTSTSRAM
ncbi:MAG: hypothetical protein ACLR3T_00115 [Alistipes finegoldii]